MTLPRRWRAGLTREQIRSVLRCERLADAGILRIQPTPHEKGYLRVTLPVCHPYARSGTNFLHRYLAERKIGRRLEPWEHVHHAPEAPKDTADVRKLEVWEECHHGLYHYAKRLSCGHELPLWKPRDERGRFTPLPKGGALEAVPF